MRVRTKAKVMGHEAGKELEVVESLGAAWVHSGVADCIDEVAVDEVAVDDEASGALEALEALEAKKIEDIVSDRKVRKSVTK